MRQRLGKPGPCGRFSGKGCHKERSRVAAAVNTCGSCVPSEPFQHAYSEGGIAGGSQRNNPESAGSGESTEVEYKYQAAVHADSSNNGWQRLLIRVPAQLTLLKSTEITFYH